MSTPNELVFLSIENVEDICLGLASLPHKSIEQRKFHGEMCQLYEMMCRRENQ